MKCARYSTSLFTTCPVYVHINKQRRTTYASFARVVRLYLQGYTLSQITYRIFHTYSGRIMVNLSPSLA